MSSLTPKAWWNNVIKDKKVIRSDSLFPFSETVSDRKLLSDCEIINNQLLQIGDEIIIYSHDRFCPFDTRNNVHVEEPRLCPVDVS